LIREALRKGAKGYVLKNVDKAQLIVAIESVNNGGTFLDSNVQEKVIESFVKSNNNPSEKVETQINESRNLFELTRREIDVLRLIVEGKKSTDIGNKLFISINTVDTHRKNIMSKCNTKNVAELVKLALDKKLI
jgi:DNA-binding NarL/FixJ family response regulator